MKSLLLLSAAILGTHGFQTAPFSRPALVRNRGSVCSQWKNPSTSHANKDCILILSSTSSDDDSNSLEGNSTPEENSEPKENANFKTRLVQDYKVAAAAYAFTVASMLLQHGIFNIDILYSATGPFLGAVLAYIIKGAAEHDRLSSDTYKRLNLFALEYATCGFGIFFTLVVRAFVVRRFPTLAYVFFGISNGLALMAFDKGFQKGVDKDKKMVDEVWEGTKNTLKGLRSFENANALGYLVGTWFFGIVTLSKLFDISSKIRSGAGVVAIGARLARFAKLSLLTGIMYTLKDAADRSRLEGTTFIQLNVAVSIVAASMSAYWYEGIMTFGVYFAFFVSAFTGLNGWASVQKKKEKEKEAKESS